MQTDQTVLLEVSSNVTPNKDNTVVGFYLDGNVGEKVHPRTEIVIHSPVPTLNFFLYFVKQLLSIQSVIVLTFSSLHIGNDIGVSKQ